MTHREPWRVSTKNGLDSNAQVMRGHEPVSDTVTGKA